MQGSMLRFFRRLQTSGDWGNHQVPLGIHTTKTYRCLSMHHSSKIQTSTKLFHIKFTVNIWDGHSVTPSYPKDQVSFSKTQRGSKPEHRDAWTLIGVDYMPKRGGEATKSNAKKINSENHSQSLPTKIPHSSLKLELHVVSVSNFTGSVLANGKLHPCVQRKVTELLLQTHGNRYAGETFWLQRQSCVNRRQDSSSSGWSNSNWLAFLTRVFFTF